MDKAHISKLGLLRFLCGRYLLNIKSAYDYRASFYSQIIFMMLNNLFMLWFWQIFFSHFSQVRGWNLEDTLLIYALSTLVFGFSNVFAGSAMDLAGLISDGELDYFIGIPVPTLLHSVVTKVRVSAIGDWLFGLILLVMIYGSDWYRVIFALFLCVPAALVFTSVIVLFSSLSFFLEESRGITQQIMNLMVAFSTYPETIFQGSMKWILYLIIPAAFMSHLPAHVLQGAFSDFAHFRSLFELFVGSFCFVALSVFVFQTGLKKYASGSSIGIRI